MAENNLAVTKPKTAAELAQDVRNNARKEVANAGFKNMKDDQITAFIVREYGLKIAQLLPPSLQGMNADRVISMCTLVISQNSDLKACDPKTIVGAVLKCAMLGFNPDPQFNECFFIPRKKNRKNEQGQWELESINCNFQIGYGGWKKLLYNTGLVRGFEIEAVHIEDEFEDNYGTDRLIRHKKCGKTPTFDTLVCAYMVVKLEGLGVFHHVLHKEKVEQLRLKGCEKEYGKVKTALSGAWLTDYDVMAMNKCISSGIRHKLPISDVLISNTKKTVSEVVSSDDAVFDITEANSAKRELVPVTVEENEPENVEVVEAQKEKPFGEKIDIVSDIFADVRSGKLPITALTPSKEQVALICELISDEVIDITVIPDELMKINKIKNAVFEIEKTAIK